MRLVLSILIISFIIISCSTKNIIITDQYAYLIENDTTFDIDNSFTKPFTDSTVIIEIDYDTLSNSSPPQLVSMEQPKYPKYKVEGASYMKEGRVVVNALVTKDGKIVRAKIIESSDKIFNKPCLEAIFDWEFIPGKINGKAVDTWLKIPFKFDLSKFKNG